MPQSGDAYTATWPNPRTTPPGTLPSNFTATNVNETNACLVSAPVPPLLGSAGGGFTLSGGLLVVNGVAWDNATLTGGIAWQWVGPTTAEATLTGATLTGGSGPSLIAVSLSLNGAIVGQGAMTFAWNPPVGDCSTQNPNQTALIEATLAQPT